MRLGRALSDIGEPLKVECGAGGGMLEMDRRKG